MLELGEAPSAASVPTHTWLSALFPVRFEYWKSTIDRQWYWHLKGENNEKLAQGEAYASKEACLRAIETVRRCSEASLHDLSPLAT